RAARAHAVAVPAAKLLVAVPLRPVQGQSRPALVQSAANLNPSPNCPNRPAFASMQRRKLQPISPGNEPVERLAFPARTSRLPLRVARFPAESRPLARGPDRPILS